MCPAFFEREVTDAIFGVQNMRFWKGLGRTRLETLIAISAVIRKRRGSAPDLLIEENFCEKKVTPILRMNQKCIFSNPT